MKADLNEADTTPSDRDRLNKYVRNGASSSAHFFNRLVGKMSVEHCLSGNLRMIAITSSTVTGLNSDSMQPVRTGRNDGLAAWDVFYMFVLHVFHILHVRHVLGWLSGLSHDRHDTYYNLDSSSVIYTCLIPLLVFVSCFRVVTDLKDNLSITLTKRDAILYCRLLLATLSNIFETDVLFCWHHGSIIQWQQFSGWLRRISVRPSVCHTPLLYKNGWTYDHANNAIR